jgi:fucose 4-O-acetylase-like acetyltransferase
MQEAISSSRNYQFDNVKGLLILLVVWGHILAYKNGNADCIGYIHYFIYFFHMPAFIFISGFFSKNAVKLRDKAFEQLILPYIVFNFLYEILSGDLNIINPTNLYWYILSLAIMRIFLPYLNQFKPYIVMALLLVISYFSDFLSEEVWRTLSIGRVLGLYPIFMFGYYLDKDRLQKYVRHHKGCCIAYGLAATAVVFVLLKTGCLSFDFATHNHLSEYGYAPWYRIVFMVLSVGMVFFLIAVLHDKRIALLSRWGEYSLLIYLFHMYFVKLVAYVFTQINFIENSSSMYMLCSFVSAVAVTMLLSLDCWSKMYDTLKNRILKVAKR